MIASGTVNVTTMARCCTVAPNTPEPNILVVGINTDGSVVTATTGADGTAQLMLREGASVSAVYPEDAEHENDVRTYVGVKPDDNLRFGDAYYTPPPAPGMDGQMTVNWVAAPGAVRYYVYSPCASSGYITGLTASMPLSSSCQTATMPLLLVAYDTNYVIVGSAYLPAADGTVGAQVNVTAGQWVTQTADNVTVSMSSIDPLVQYTYMRVYGQYGSLSYNDNRGTDVIAGTATTGLTIPSTATSMYAQVELGRNGNFGQQEYFKAGPAPFALQHTNLPWIDGQSLVSFQQRRAIWFETPGTYDAAVLFLNWSRSESKNTRYFNWTVILPPNVADFRFPDPPAQLVEFLPETTDNVGHQLSLVDLSSAASYDAARALPEWRLTNASSAVAHGDEPNAAVSSDGEGFSFD